MPVPSNDIPRLPETGYRDLYVELPPRTMAELQDNRPISAARVDHDLQVLRDLEHVITNALGWSSMLTGRLPSGGIFLWAVLDRCGHGVCYELTDRAIAATSLFMALHGEIVRLPRTCSCVPLPPVVS